MSKKTARRPRMAPGKSQPRTYSGANLPSARITTGDTATAQQTNAAPGQRGNRTLRQVTAAPVDFAAEYAYVGSDLRRVLMIAGSLFAILIVLSFLIR